MQRLSVTLFGAALGLPLMLLMGLVVTSWAQTAPDASVLRLVDWLFQGRTVGHALVLSAEEGKLLDRVKNATCQRKTAEAEAAAEALVNGYVKRGKTNDAQALWARIAYEAMACATPASRKLFDWLADTLVRVEQARDRLKCAGDTRATELRARLAQVRSPCKPQAKPTTSEADRAAIAKSQPHLKAFEIAMLHTVAGSESEAVSALASVTRMNAEDVRAVTHAVSLASAMPDGGISDQVSAARTFIHRR